MSGKVNEVVQVQRGAGSEKLEACDEAAEFFAVRTCSVRAKEEVPASFPSHQRRRMTKYQAAVWHPGSLLTARCPSIGNNRCPSLFACPED